MSSKPEPTKPSPGQESVWDYPRPPRLEPVTEPLRVVLGGETLAETSAGYRVLETSHPPVFYIPPGDVRCERLVPSTLLSFCEFKGVAAYWAAADAPEGAPPVAWSYPNPTKAFLPIKDYFAFYASRVESCWVGEEKVEAQEGDFYGGWITSRIVGPFKGPPGTRGW